MKLNKMGLNQEEIALNGVCPYFTMFPLSFPYSVLRNHASKGDWVIDPFCGRGTTNYASRTLGLPSVGIDASPVAAALSQAKLANTTPDEILQAMSEIFEEVPEPQELPMDEFWEWAFHTDVLPLICRLREGLMRDCTSDARKALRAILMGALHGPLGKTRRSYFSNQSQRTYAPKPRYAVKFWKHHQLHPPFVDVFDIVRERAERYYNETLGLAIGEVVLGDSTQFDTYDKVKTEKFSWVITSPPYYGMRTYLPDQWLRLWFVGGQSSVDYSSKNQLEHSSPDYFASQLRQVWGNVGSLSKSGAKLIVRFGGIHDRNVSSIDILKESFRNSGWKILTRKAAGSASKGRRQALHFSNVSKSPIDEYDLWAKWQG